MILVGTTTQPSPSPNVPARCASAAGHVQPGPSVRLRDGVAASVGDIISTRRNDRRIAAGPDYVTDRDQWRIDATTHDGQVHVTNVLQPEPPPCSPPRIPPGTPTLPTPRPPTRRKDRPWTPPARSSTTTPPSPGSTRAHLRPHAQRGVRRHRRRIARRHTTRPTTARVAVLADIVRRVLPDRSATETEQQLWADVDALHSWTPVYDDLLARAHITRVPRHRPAAPRPRARRPTQPRPRAAGTHQQAHHLRHRRPRTSRPAPPGPACARAGHRRRHRRRPVLAARPAHAAHHRRPHHRRARRPVAHPHRTASRPSPVTSVMRYARWPRSATAATKRSPTSPPRPGPPGVSLSATSPRDHAGRRQWLTRGVSSPPTATPTDSAAHIPSAPTAQQRHRPMERLAPRPARPRCRHPRRTAHHRARGRARPSHHGAARR